MLNISLFNLIKNQFGLNLNSEHGIKHWEKVRTIGNYLAEQTKADIEVIDLFAFLHDSKRENNGYDPEHGLRAAQFARELVKKGLLNLEDNQLEQLCFACEHHNNSSVKSQDTTIQTCWDADRLDLWRIDIVPQKQFLNTAFAKQDRIIEFWR